jgi:sulfate permease, SulP family
MRTSPTLELLGSRSLRDARACLSRSDERGTRGGLHATRANRDRAEPIKLPVLRSLSDPKLAGDPITGLTVWAVLVPEALAYASIAGGFPGRRLVRGAGSPDPLRGVRQLAPTGHRSDGGDGSALGGDRGRPRHADSSDCVQLTATLAITVGLLAIGAAALRLGFSANFISDPVLKGFIIGRALTVIVGQLPRLFGIDSGADNFFEQLWEFVKSIDQTCGLTLLVGGLSLVRRRVEDMEAGSIRPGQQVLRTPPLGVLDGSPAAHEVPSNG